jgi:hypothetical protein
MTNYSKNENVNVSVGFRVCRRDCDLKSTWGVVVYSIANSFINIMKKYKVILT